MIRGLLQMGEKHPASRTADLGRHETRRHPQQMVDSKATRHLAVRLTSAWTNRLGLKIFCGNDEKIICRLLEFSYTRTHEVVGIVSGGRWHLDRVCRLPDAMEELPAACK